MSRSAYAAFLLQGVVLIALMVVLRPLDLPAEVKAFMASRTPMLRLGNPEDVEAAAVYLASDAARYHTGDILVIDGGWLASYM